MARNVTVLGAGMRDGALVVRFATDGQGDPLPEASEAGPVASAPTDVDADGGREAPVAIGENAHP